MARAAKRADIADRRGKALPVKPKLVHDVYEAYELRLKQYSDFLRIVPIIASGRYPRNTLHPESTLDALVSKMRHQPFTEDELKATLEFVASVRVAAGRDVVRIRQAESASILILIEATLHEVVRRWRQSTDRAAHTGIRYANGVAFDFNEEHAWRLPPARAFWGLFDIEKALVTNALHAMETGANERVTARQSTGRRPRVSGTVLAQRIDAHLKAHPDATIADIAATVGCSRGFVSQSAPWKQHKKLRTTAKRGTPKTVRLDDRVLDQAGSIPGLHRRRHQEEMQEIDERLDKEGRKLLFSKIEEYRRNHPNASPHETAAAVGCTAGIVEERDFELQQLLAEQEESRAEDEDREDPTARRGARRKWVGRGR